MTLNFKIIEEEKVWNEYLLKTNPHAFFQDFLWYKIYHQTGVASWPWGIYRHNKLIGLALVRLVKAKRGAFLHLRHGPVITQEYLSRIDFWDQLINFFRQQANKYNCWWLRVSPYVRLDTEVDKSLKQIGFRVAPIQGLDAQNCWVLDLSQTEVELLSQMRKTTRYLVKKAQNLGVEIKEITDIKIFSKLYRETASRHGFVMHPDVEAEWSTFFRAKRAFMLAGEYQEQILSCGIFVKFAHQLIYRHGASVKSQIPASYLLQWEAICRAKRWGTKEYNFWGIAPSNKVNHRWSGITLFKKGFGGQLRQFAPTYDLAFSPLYGLSSIIELARKVARNY